MTDDPTLGEVTRTQERLLSELSKHVEDCVKHREKNAETLQSIRDYMTAEQAARKAGQEERQRSEDAQNKRLQRIYWLTGISMAALAAMQAWGLFQRTGHL